MRMSIVGQQMGVSQNNGLVSCGAMLLFLGIF